MEVSIAAHHVQKSAIQAIYAPLGKVATYLHYRAVAVGFELAATILEVIMRDNVTAIRTAEIKV